MRTIEFMGTAVAGTERGLTVWMVPKEVWNIEMFQLRMFRWVAGGTPGLGDEPAPRKREVELLVTGCAKDGIRDIAIPILLPEGGSLDMLPRDAKITVTRIR